MLHNSPAPKSRSFIELTFSVAMKIFGALLFCFFMGLATMISYSLVFDICYIHLLATQNYFLYGVMLTFSIFIIINVYFNYIMASFTNPGGVHEEKTDLSMQDTLSPDNPARRLNGRTNSDEDLEGGNQPQVNKQTCKKCNKFKPERAHHCSICNTCVLKMDHHCPWLSNCVGHRNHRYFLLMILYIGIGTTLYSLAMLPIINNESYWSYQKYASPFFGFCVILCLALSVVMWIFCFWNWYLAITGQTAIEFWGRTAQNKDLRNGVHLYEIRKYDFRLKPYMRNLEYIFGTTSFFKMLLPSLRSQEHSGMYWSEM